MMNCPTCNADHHEGNCIFPICVMRCSVCKSMIINGRQHTCNTEIQGYRLNVQCKKTTVQFKLRLKNALQKNGGADVTYFEQGHFKKLEKMSKVFCPSTGGIFILDTNQIYSILSYERIKNITFKLYVAILYNKRRPYIELCIDVEPNGMIKFMNCSASLNRGDGSLELADHCKMNTAMIIGIDPNSKEVKLESQCNGEINSAVWTLNGGWKIDQMQATDVLKQTPSLDRCMNCNQNHTTENCHLPLLTMHCSNCLVASFDGKQHDPPCMPINKVSTIRRDILGFKPFTLFQMVYKNDDGEVLFLANDMTLQPFNSDVNLISMPAESLLTFQVDSNKEENYITLKQTTFKRCSIIIAVLDKTNVFRIRFRLVITPMHGLLVFKQTKTLTIRDGKVAVPMEYSKNMITLLAIKPKNTDFYSALNIYANQGGVIDLYRFNGFKAHFGIDISENHTRSFIDECIDASESTMHLRPIRFNNKLFEFDDNVPLSTFKAQRTATAEEHQPEENVASNWSSDDGAQGLAEGYRPERQMKLTEMSFEKLTEANLSYNVETDQINDQITPIFHHKCIESIPTIPPSPKISSNIESVRNSLPVAAYRRGILDTIEKNRVTVISGATGSGKSTQVPQFIMEEATRNGMVCRIILTQPRRLAATSLAKRISEERGDIHGESVGHQIRLEKCRKAHTNLILTTSGYLLKCLTGLQKDNEYKNVTHIILDEIHEREINTDLLLITIKMAMKKVGTFKVILMSATLDADLFCEYFDSCPKIDVPGRLFDVTSYHLAEILHRTNYMTDEMKEYMGNDQCTENRLEKLLHAYEYNQTVYEEIDYTLFVHVILYIHHNTMYNGSILVFLPGYHDIMTVHDMIESRLEGQENYKLFSLHSNIEQEDVFSALPRGMRKIILSTNIAETSITIDDVVYVIDSGKVKELNYDSSTESTCLDTVDISKACANQRSGRAGRTRSGFAYRLYSLKKFERMAEYTTPGMLRSSLLDVCLKSKLLAPELSITQFLSRAIQQPSQKRIEHSIEILTKISALDSNENMTQLGVHLAQMPIDCQLGKMVLYSIFLRCLDPILTIVSALSVKSLYMFKKKKNEPRDESSDEIVPNPYTTNIYSDHLAFVKIYEAWTNETKKADFCKRYKISKRNMESITELRKLVLHHLKLSGYIQDNNEFNNENATNWEVLKCCIVAGMYPNICHANSYCDTFDSEKSPNMKIDWSSVVHDRDLNSIGTEWLTYGQKKRIGNNIYVGNLTIVPIIDLIFFAGSLNATISDDGTSFEIDKFIQCIVDKRDGPLLNNIRKKLNVIFNKFLKNEVLSINEKSILETVVDTVKKEDTIEKYIDREISMH